MPSKAGVARRLWLLFAQTATIGLALLFIVESLRPEWIESRRGAAVVTIAEAPPAVRAPMPAIGDKPRTSYNDAVRIAVPAVVSININGNRPRDRRTPGGPPEHTLASGVIASADGYIITNRHVVEGGDDIEVALSDGRRAGARVVGSDAETDIAVLKVDLDHLPVITFGRIEDAQVGDVVLAIGNPFGVGQTVTMGIISALGRNHLNLSNFENYIQTDAAINPGNSGGALVNAAGDLIGINAAIYTKSSGGSLGIGFAVPVSTVKDVLEGIVAHGEMIRGYIGVEPRDITPADAEALTFGRSQGALLAGVYRGGPADKAGVRPGDVLIAVDNQAIVDTMTMLEAIARLKPGSTARLKLIRRTGEVDVSVKVAARPRPGTNPDD